MEILFVCSGNVIRSPFAQGLLEKALAEAGIEDVVIRSAGTLGLEGCRADREACRLARERGFSLDAHRSRGIDPHDLSRADLIVAMERAHLRAIEQMDPTTSPRLRLIRMYEPIESPPDLAGAVGRVASRGKEHSGPMGDFAEQEREDETRRGRWEEAVDLADPVGAGREALLECFEILERCVLDLASRLANGDDL